MSLKGIIKSISEPISIANGKTKFQVEVEGDSKKYDCWDMKGKVVGDELEYEIRSNSNPQYPDNLNVIVAKAYGKSFAKNVKAENARTALICATNMKIAGLSADLKVKEVASNFFDWLESKSY